MIDHVGFAVQDLARSRCFYEAASLRINLVEGRSALTPFDFAQDER